ncbi:MAG: hypothetical protein LH702_04185, partial [Phormidesmis sp. CAN_BIN44]|nr:hypothetical protein [Phormidesmis sp. CAN_BIN44]
FMVFVASTFALSLRTVWDATWLITSALTLFVIGVGILLLSVTLLLLDLHKSDRPFWQEVRGILILNQSDTVELRPDRAGRRTTSDRSRRSPDMAIVRASRKARVS